MQIIKIPPLNPSNVRVNVRARHIYTAEELQIIISRVTARLIQVIQLRWQISRTLTYKHSH